MCEPLTIAALSAMAVGGAIKGYSEYTAGQANAKFAEASASLARQTAASHLQVGEVEAGRFEEKGRQIAAQQQVAFSGNGVDTSSGSAATVIGSTGVRSELDAMTARNNAARRAWGYEVEAATDDAKASASRTRSILGAVGTGIGTLGSMASTGAAMHSAAGGGGGTSGYEGFDSPDNYG